MLATLASGCSTINVAYTAGPTVLSFIADGYLDLDGDQGVALKQRILAVREWDRSTNLAAAGNPGWPRTTAKQTLCGA